MTRRVPVSPGGKRESILAEREALVGLVVGAANHVYTVPGIRPATVAGLGLSSRTRVVPRTPRRIVATMRENGVVRVNWDRSGNAAEVVFMVETRGADGPCVHAASVTRTQALLRGVAPGVETWFRVRATKGGVTASPSGMAVPYRASEGRAARAAA